MDPHLRTLSGIIDFECAARHRSFRLAAAELNKTPAAISQQVKQLEQTLGISLFERHPRHICLTPQGQELSQLITRMLHDLRAKISMLRVPEGAQTLHVTATHSFAIKWLIPRLQRYTERFPGFDLRIDSSDALRTLQEGVCDIAIRHHKLQRDAMNSLLVSEDLIVAYSPNLVTETGPVTLQQLLRYPLLYEDSPEHWHTLLNVHGLDRHRYDLSHQYSHSGLLVQSAVAGLGVGLLPYCLAYEDIVEGRLIMLPHIALPSGYGYSVFCRDDQPKMRQFVEWLQEEVAAMRLMPRAPAAKP